MNKIQLQNIYLCAIVHVNALELHQFIGFIDKFFFNHTKYAIESSEQLFGVCCEALHHKENS